MRTQQQCLGMVYAWDPKSQSFSVAMSTLSKGGKQGVVTLSPEMSNNDHKRMQRGLKYNLGQGHDAYMRNMTIRERLRKKVVEKNGHASGNNPDKILPQTDRLSLALPKTKFAALEQAVRSCKTNCDHSSKQ